MIAFLQQLVCYQGFYDEALEWVGIERVHIVCSMNPPGGVGRAAVTTRFTALCQIVYINYPDREQLQSIYASYMTAVLGVNKPRDPVYQGDANARKMAATMVEIYEKLKAKFTVDDARHYIYNPRDVTEWVFALLRYDLQKNNLLDVIIYEASRMFGDRLINEKAKQTFEKLVKDIVNAGWKFEQKGDPKLFTSFTPEAEEKKDDEPPAELSVLGKPLLPMPTAAFSELVQDAMKVYERDMKALNLVLYPQVLETIAVADRVMSRPGGSLLMVGDSGVGRRSAASLVASMHKMMFWTPAVTLAYNHTLFRVDLKEQLRLAGIEGHQVMLYLEEQQVVHNSCLEDINSLLSSGEVPGLYLPNEVDPLCTPIKDLFANLAGKTQAKTVWGLFCERVKSNLHIVLSMSPTHPDFGLRTESNPAIYTKCCIMWLNTWSLAGFKDVPTNKLQPIINSGTHVIADVVLDQLVHIHNSMGRKGSPLKYVALLDNYNKVYEHHFSQINGNKKKLELGLTKLGEAEHTVAVLSKEASEKKILVTNAQIEADKALETITERMAVAGERTIETNQLSEKLAVEEVELTKKSSEITQTLSGIQPILDAAKAAVGGIKKDNLNEIRSLRMPPKPIQDVLSAVMTIMGQNDLAWNSMKAFLGQPSMKEDLLNFDSRRITPKIAAACSAIIAGAPESFKPEVIAKASVAAAPLAAWSQANLSYATVLTQVKPLEESLAAANKGLAGARNRLATCKSDLAALDQEVKDLKARFAKMTSEAETLKLDLAKIAETLGGAQELLGKLSGEKGRWGTTVEVLKKEVLSLPVKALLGAAAVTYLGSYAEDGRASFLKDWQTKCKLAEYNLRGFMAPESQYLKWKAEGLADDQLSMENGLIILNSVQFPYVVDPNSQAIEWLKSNLAGKQLQVVMQQDPSFVTSLELAVRFGKTLIVQEVDQVIPMLYPILRRDLFRKDSRMVVQVGEKAVDYNDSFRIFMTTRNSAPDLTDTALALVNMVCFTVTRAGLQGQLLGIALQFEKPELEKEKSRLLADEEKFKIQLADLEAALLKELSESTGNILENKVLIESLNQTKTQAISIAAALEESKKVQIVLIKQADAYKPIAFTGSVLFFAIAQLTSVNNMYDFALPGFLTLFNTALSAADPTRGQEGKEEKRVANLKEGLKMLVFRNVVRSLFKDDRLMFGMHLVHCLIPELWKPKEWEMFTGELVSTETSSSSFPWIPADRAPYMSAILAEFPYLKECKFEDSNIWKAWITNPKCEEQFPAHSTFLSAFQKLLIVQVCRPDRLQAAMNTFACESLGVSAIAPDSLSMAKLVEETTPNTPILFITAAGADPSFEIEQYVKATIGEKGLKQVAMGSGQMDTAMEAMREAVQAGTHVVLKNLHLVTSWLPALEKALKSATPHKNFRMWLTTEEHASFPPILLQTACKVSYESPPGVKQNMMRTMEGWSAEYFKKGGVMRAQLLFCLAWFHAICLERRTYIPQGWTKIYEFLPADMRSGADIIDATFGRLEKAGHGANTAAIPWTTLWGLMKYAIYGGRIDNDHDVRILVTYLSTFFSDKVLQPTAASPAGRQLSKGIVLPISNNYDDYMRVVQGMADVDQPYLFGLANNVEGSVFTIQAVNLIVALKKLAVSGAALGKFDRDAWKAGIGPLLALWDKLTSDPELLKKPRKINRDESSLSPSEAFVILEIGFVAGMVKSIHTTLNGIKQVLNGTGLLTSTIKEEGSRLLVGKTPSSWTKHWWGPDDPATWVKEVSSRRVALNSWVDRVEQKKLLSAPLKMSDLFRSRVLLNALRQESSRVSKKPIDDLKLISSWDASLIPASAPIRVTFEGLMLSGCSYADGTLGNLNADSPAWSPIPPVIIAYVDNNENPPYPEKNALAVPLYFTSSREEYITELNMPCKGNRNVCVLTGVALCLSTVV